MNERQKFRSGDTPLMWCAKKGVMDKFKLLLDCPRVDLNLKDKFGDTVALWALKNNKYEFVKLLASNSRLQINVLDNEGNTIVKIAK